MHLLILGNTQEGPGTVIALPSTNVELLCNVTGGVPNWRVNDGGLFTPNQLFMGNLPGHNISLPDGRNIIVEDIIMNDNRNGSIYTCIVIQGIGTPDLVSDPTTLLVAGKYIVNN